MPLVRKIVRTGTSKAVTLPKSWLDLIERQIGQPLREVTMEVNQALTIKPILPEKRGDKTNAAT